MLKNIFIGIFFVLALAACSYVPRYEIIKMPNNEQIKVQLAETALEFRQGLSGIEGMDGYEGMLFINNQPQQVTFWMNKMLFSLDIIYLDKDGFVMEVLENNLPCEQKNCPLLRSKSQNIKYILEIPAGLADKYGLKKETKIIIK